MYSCLPRLYSDTFRAFLLDIAVPMEAGFTVPTLHHTLQLERVDDVIAGVAKLTDVTHTRAQLKTQQKSPDNSDKVT